MVDGEYVGLGEDEGEHEREDEDGDEGEGEGADVSESHCVMSQVAHCPPRAQNLTQR